MIAPPQPPRPHHAAHERLAQLGLTLPQQPPTQYSYSPVASWGQIAFISGQIPKRDGAVAFTGPITAATDLDRGVAAAELATLGALAALDHEFGLHRVARVLKLSVYVASVPEFSDPPAVAEGASRLLRNVFGTAGQHARTALGLPQLPKDATVELDLVVALTPEEDAA
ncbi:RidA family protein [Leucobacter chromiireducens]|uniref:RidA family protein n=1 Tax=Leucobacter chromiireducens TaxID=283877 RepID=UPI000F643260|nr:RidA family protein [Leucobacter chromiireducens]